MIKPMEKTTTRFQRWLKAAPEILEAATPEELRETNRIFTQFLKPKATVLVEIHSDGFIQVYGDEHIQCKIINRPHSTIANEARVDEFVDSVLPQRFQQIRWPGRGLLNIGNVRRKTIADVLQRVEALNELEHCRWSNNRSRQLAILEA